MELLSVQLFLFLFTGFFLYPSLPMPRQAATPSSSQFVSYVCSTVRTWNKDKAHTTGRKQTRPTNGQQLQGKIAYRNKPHGKLILNQPKRKNYRKKLDKYDGQSTCRPIRTNQPAWMSHSIAIVRLVRAISRELILHRIILIIIKNYNFILWMGGVVSKPTIHFPPNMRHSNSQSQFLVPRDSPCMKLQFSWSVETEEEDPRQTTSTPLWELLDDTRVRAFKELVIDSFSIRYGNGESISRVDGLFWGYTSHVQFITSQILKLILGIFHPNRRSWDQVMHIIITPWCLLSLVFEIHK